LAFVIFGTPSMPIELPQVWLETAFAIIADFRRAKFDEDFLTARA